MTGRLSGLLRNVNPSTSGAKAEQLSGKYIQRQGYKVIARNARYKAGEIDLIAEKDDQRIFIEVKYRKDNRHGAATEFVDLKKQQKLIKAALQWIQDHDPEMNYAYRFDVMTMEGSANSINWIQNAFEAHF